ncbi:MAG: NmrA/HSCARG family protein [Gemmatimonadota bacterium]|nr:NmrA/HSCARG family protein [Gemmatimonadota bacterium]
MARIRFSLRNLTLVLLVSVTSAAAWGQEPDRGSRMILVSGATGLQGGAVARELTRRGYAVRGLTRNPQSDAARALTGLGIQMVRGDFDDAASLDRALEGAYGAFSVQQYRGVGVDGEIRQSKAFADAAKRVGIQHFVYTSVAKAPLGTGVPQFESKALIESYIRSLDIPYTIVRPASFMSTVEAFRADAEAGSFSGPLAPDFERVFVAPSDIGRLVAEAFDDPSNWLGREISIASDRITYAGIAAAMTRVIGRPVVYRQTPWQDFVASAPHTTIAATIWYRDNIDPVDVGALRRQFPWLLTFEEYLIEAGWRDR